MGWSGFSEYIIKILQNKKSWLEIILVHKRSINIIKVYVCILKTNYKSNNEK